MFDTFVGNFHSPSDGSELAARLTPGLFEGEGGVGHASSAFRRKRRLVSPGQPGSSPITS